MGDAALIYFKPRDAFNGFLRLLAGRSCTFREEPPNFAFMAISTGTPAPAFTLKSKSADGLSAISLADTAGKKKTVLLFFPLAFTGVCQEELCSVSGGLAEYSDLNAVVYGISVDSPFAQEAFAKSAGISIPLLSDFNKEVAKAYDVLDEDFVPAALGFHGVAKRSAFVVDESGVVTYAWSSDDPKQLPPFDEVKAALGA
jgi:peroxiredoxin